MSASNLVGGVKVMTFRQLMTMDKWEVLEVVKLAT
jgi:hypothetical protein